jgi:hypothetical protein
VEAVAASGMNAGVCLRGIGAGKQTSEVCAAVGVLKP